MSEWFVTLGGMRARAWDTLAIGVSDPDHPARRPVLATVSEEGWPEARTVVLRAAEPEAGSVAVYTDRMSDKVRSLKSTPLAALHVWDPDQALQIRLLAEVSVEKGDALRPIWDVLPDAARLSYGVAPLPGRPIPDALAYRKSADFNCFARLHCLVVRIDVLHLGVQHRRAVFTRVSDWQGQWLVP